MTKAQSKVFNLILKGKKNQQIADELGISIHTVKIHVKNILREHNVKGRVELILKINPPPGLSRKSKSVR